MIFFHKFCHMVHSHGTSFYHTLHITWVVNGKIWRFYILLTWTIYLWHSYNSYSDTCDIITWLVTKWISRDESDCFGAENLPFRVVILILTFSFYLFCNKIFVTPLSQHVTWCLTFKFDMTKDAYTLYSRWYAYAMNDFVSYVIDVTCYELGK